MRWPVPARRAWLPYANPGDTVTLAAGTYA
jgi:hypothetical protein